MIVINFIFSQKKQTNINNNVQNRTETLFDAVVAIAMTMIALDISIPLKKSFDFSALQVLSQNITVYLISFIALGSIWGIHVLIYSSYSSLGSILDVIINIILMFIITLFPILTKLLSLFNASFILNCVYICCYVFMEILVVSLLLIATHNNTILNYQELNHIYNILKVCKPKIEENIYQDLIRKFEIANKYIYDKVTFRQLYMEFISTLPNNLKCYIQQKKQKQKIQYLQIIAFYIILSIAVLLSVLTMILNPFLCYFILSVSIIISFLLNIITKKYTKGMISYEL